MAIRTLSYALGGRDRGEGLCFECRLGLGQFRSELGDRRFCGFHLGVGIGDGLLGRGDRGVGLFQRVAGGLGRRGGLGSLVHGGLGPLLGVGECLGGGGRFLVGGGLGVGGFLGRIGLRLDVLLGGLLVVGGLGDGGLQLGHLILHALGLGPCSLGSSGGGLLLGSDRIGLFLQFGFLQNSDLGRGGLLGLQRCVSVGDGLLGLRGTGLELVELGLKLLRLGDGGLECFGWRRFALGDGREAGADHDGQRQNAGQQERGDTSGRPVVSHVIPFDSMKSVRPAAGGTVAKVFVVYRSSATGSR